MANPRIVTGPRDGIGFRAETLRVDGSTLVYHSTAPMGIDPAVLGRAVTLVTGSVDTVKLSGAGDVVYGKLDHIEQDGCCTVQIEGECKLPQGNAVTVVRGNRIVGALGPASAPGYIGPAVTTAASDVAAGRHTVEDVAVTTAISVYLGR
jgi:hypothetical protein